jgi:hypothetical protein
VPRQISPWLLVGLGAAVLAYAKRSTLMLFGMKIVDAAHAAIFEAQLPDRAKPYASIIIQVSNEQDVDPFLIFAIGDRESLWGTALDANLTGDYGHGRGIMQIDDRIYPTWLAQNDWTDALTNVRKGVSILKQKMSVLSSRGAIPGLTTGTSVTLGATSANMRGVSPGSYPDPRPLSGVDLWTAAIAAYNTGEGNVIANLAAGKPAEFTSAGGDYATDVADRASGLAGKYQAATA